MISCTGRAAGSWEDEIIKVGLGETAGRRGGRLQLCYCGLIGPPVDLIGHCCFEVFLGSVVKKDEEEKGKKERREKKRRDRF